MKRTRWFPVSAKPARNKDGWFEYKYSPISGAEVIRYWWDGMNWRYCPGGSVMTPWAGHRWRGLTEKAR